DLADWDISPSPMRNLLHRLSVKSDVELCLVLPSHDLGRLSVENASMLRSLVEVCRVKLVSGSGLRLSQAGVCLASVESRDGTFYSWATKEVAKGVPDQMWGSVGDEPLVASPSGPPTVSAAGVVLPNSAVVAGAHV